MSALARHRAGHRVTLSLFTLTKKAAANRFLSHNKAILQSPQYDWGTPVDEPACRPASTQ
jgi:hypothetical protein